MIDSVSSWMCFVFLWILQTHSFVMSLLSDSLLFWALFNNFCSFAEMKWRTCVSVLMRVSVLAINRPGRYQMGECCIPGPCHSLQLMRLFCSPSDTQRVRAQGQPSSLDFAVSANFGNWSKQGLEFILETERPLESIFTGRNKPSKIDSANTIIEFSSKSNQSIYQRMNRWTLTYIVQIVHIVSFESPHYPNWKWFMLLLRSLFGGEGVYVSS